MIEYNKLEIREALSIEQIFDLLQNWGGEPEYTSFGIISATICHNFPGEGSRKLYFYENTGLFKCYTGCDSTFDIFELTIKVFKIQQGQELDLNEAIRYIAYHFSILGTEIDNTSIQQSDDWKQFAEYERIQNIQVKDKIVTLKEYDNSIIDRMNYKIKLTPWLNEGISQDTINFNRIGFYPGGDQITIPHYDIDGRFVGLRGRSLCAREGELYGKYRPIRANKQLYNHPLGLNLYGIDKTKNNIELAKTAIIFESEKSVLLFQTYFGQENNISVACCGSSVSNQQVQLLLSLGVREIIIAFDRQFQAIGDDEFKHLKANLIKIHNKYKNYATISLIFDKHMITNYKASPIDEGKDKFLQLYKERIYL